MLRKLSSKSFQFLSASRSFSTNLPASNEPKQQREISREVKEAPKKILRKLDYLYGVNPVMTAIYSNQRKIHELFISENLKEDNFRVQNIVNKANALKIPVKQMHKDKLEKFAQNQPHQGVILKCEPLQYIRIGSPADLLKEKKTKGLVWIFIDQVTDPQNFGAILRAATFLGADGILVAEENRCPLTPTVSKTSAGALELIEINCIKDSVEFMKSCKAEGWRVVATALEKGNPKLKEVADLTLNADDNIMILLGSEHLGLKKGLINSSTDIVHIAPGIPDEEYKFPYTLLDSLNVSVSCGIVTKIVKEKLKKAQL